MLRITITHDFKIDSPQQDYQSIFKNCFFFFQADPGLAAKCLFELINEKPVKIAIFGPPKSNPYEIVGQITPKFYLTQVSYRFSTM